jgi:carboxymethylenebutenolidase
MPDIKIRSLESQEFSAYCALPEAGTGPGLIVIQEVFGVNDFLRRTCDEFAKQGYMVVAPDLFWRLEPDLQLNPKNEADMKKAIELYGKFDTEGAVRDLLSTLAHVRGMKGCSGKVGSVGYCLGGKLAFLMSTRSDVDASVGYYGVKLEQYLGEVHDIRMPLMLHIAALDKHTPPDVVKKLTTSFARNPAITTHVYDGADHAFARIGGDHYNKEAADLANQRTREFFAHTLQV